MTVFFTDLDNTLVYSHRRNLPAGKVCVEYLNGREQSFMTGFTYAYMTGNTRFAVVPVTTRTEAQYRRLTCMDAMGVRAAVLCNGGKLLLNGAEDQDWTLETLRAAEPELPALRKAAALLQSRSAGAALHEPEPYMVYAGCEDPADVCRELQPRVDPALVQVAHDRRKIYLICASVSKGAALRRFRRRFPADHAVAAGDDPLDVPMLNEADYAMAPASIADRISHDRVAVLAGEVISDEICARLEKMTSAK